MDIIAPLIHKLEKFITLTSEDKQTLKHGISHIEHIEKRKDIIKEGARPDNVHLLVEGWACRYKHVEQGNRAILAYLIPGDLCDVHIALLNHMDHSISTITPATIAYIPRERIDHIIKANGALTRAIFWTMLLEESTLREWFVNTNSRPADKRLASLFCELYVRACIAGLNHGNTIDFPLTQEDLADSVGLTPVHTNRMLQKLRKDGLMILSRKKMTILDWHKLKEFGEFSSHYLHLDEDTIKQCTSQL